MNQNTELLVEHELARNCASFVSSAFVVKGGNLKSRKPLSYTAVFQSKAILREIRSMTNVSSV
jgi:hypothetical protein